jgi:hypothetical protein
VVGFAVTVAKQMLIASGLFTNPIGQAIGWSFMQMIKIIIEDIIYFIKSYMLGECM